MCLNDHPDRTTSLCPVRLNISEPSSSLMDIDGIMKLLNHEAVENVVFIKKFSYIKI